MKPEKAAALRTQHADFINILRYMGMDIIEIANSGIKNLNQRRVDMVGDLAFVLNGVALILRPADRSRDAEIVFVRTILRRDAQLKIVEVSTADPGALISGRDILWTGKEILVGLTRGQTNESGARQLAAAFPEYSVQTLEMPSCDSGRFSLKNYVTVGGAGFLLMCGQNRGSKMLVDQICRRARYLYEYLDLPDMSALASLYLNGLLLHPGKEDIQQSFRVLD